MQNFWSNHYVHGIAMVVVLTITLVVAHFPALANISVAFVLTCLSSYISKKAGIVAGMDDKVGAIKA